MPTIQIPSGDIVVPRSPLSDDLLIRLLTDYCTPDRDFTGFISIEASERLFLLFLFRSRPYAAGISVGEKPSSLNLKDFFRELARLHDGTATISIHATDPVLLKCLLIFIQDDPTAKAPSGLINLEAVLSQIRDEAADALIILEKNQMFNFFFMKNGTRGMSYLSDIEFSGNQGLPIDEQLLLYAFQPGVVSIDALIYRDIATRQAPDAEEIGLDEMFSILAGDDKKGADAAGGFSEAEVVVEENLVLSVLEGNQKGQTLTGPIPCVLGRKEADIIVDDPMVSKRHAAIHVVNGKLTLVDLNSTNGTSVNGRPIKQHNIVSGDIIVLGGSALKVVRITPP